MAPTAKRLVAIALILLGLAGPARAATTTVPYGSRNIEVYVPDQLPATGMHPLVVVLHGGLGNAARIASGRSESALNMDGAADRYGFIVAYLNGTPVTRVMGDDKKGWNAGQCCGQPAQNNVDDVGYIAGAVRFLTKTYGVDPRRIYGLGHSNGAMMTLRMACETNIYAGAISLSGALEIGTENCPGARGRNIMEIHGGKDANVPLAGGMGKGISHADFKAQAYTQQVFKDSGATYTLQVMPEAAHQLDTIEDAIEKAEGITLQEKAARYFGLDR